MELKLNGNTSAQNMQIGDRNTMTVTYEGNGDILQEKDWKELEEFLHMRLTELPETDNSYRLAKKGMDYTEVRDEKGLKGFLMRNKDSFFCNVLSDIASSGLILLLSQLSF